MMRSMNVIAGLTMVTGSLYLGTAVAAPVVFSGSGAATITALDAFRTAIGGAKNAGAPQANGRREISWDGVKLDGTDANPSTQVVDTNNTVVIPVDRFQSQGTLFADPYAVSGDGFASVNPDTAGQFPPFSPNNTFVMQDENPGEFNDRFIGESFTLPGTLTPAVTQGFGAIFIDAEVAGSSSIEYFGSNGASLGTFDVPTGASGETQFLGVLFDSPLVGSVNLTVGTNSLFNFDPATGAFLSFGPESLAQGIDLVVTDDFVFAEPTELVAVPEPATLALTLGALSLLGWTRRAAKR